MFRSEQPTDANLTPEPISEAEWKQRAHSLLSAYRKEIDPRVWNSKPGDYASGRAILDSEPRLQIYVLFAILDRDGSYTLNTLQTLLYARGLPWTALDLERLLAFHTNRYMGDWGSMLRPIQRFLERGNQLTPTLEAALRAMQQKLPQGQNAEARKLCARLSALLGKEKSALPDAGETWADVALADIAVLPSEQQVAWKRLLAQAQDSEAAKPTAAWRKEG